MDNHCHSESHHPAYGRKQQWKELPGNRYKGEELKHMAENFGPFTVHKRRTKVMYLD